MIAGWIRQRCLVTPWVAIVLALTAVEGWAQDDDPFVAERLAMVGVIERIARQVGGDVPPTLDPRVLETMRTVPRHRFVPERLWDSAYDDRPLPIGHSQTISQPYIVALMTDLLGVSPGDRVLEIGTGSGYQAAVLAALGAEVYSIEIVTPLVTSARAALDGAGFAAVTTRQGDGYDGWAEHAPFTGIVVTAAASHIPPPLIDQLAPGGRMVIPVGPAFMVQHLVLVEKDADGEVTSRILLPVRFVPLTGGGSE